MTQKIPDNAIKVWGPHPGPQTAFLESVEREVLYGGAAGGGKSDGLLMAAVMEYQNRHHRGIIFRKTYPELKDLVRRSEEIYPLLGGRYRSSYRDWRFPSGATVEFGYIDKKKDRYKYKRAWNFIGWDELTHWADDEIYVWMLHRLRTTTGSGCLLRVRGTTNPGGAGHEWVRARWRIPDSGTGSEYYDDVAKYWRIFIPSRIKDNPSLAGTSYEQDLNALPEDQRKMLRDGRWDVVAGAMFSSFDYRKHTCDAFPIGATWKKWRGADDGFNAPACVLWAAEHDKRLYIVGELYRPGMRAEVMAEETMKRDLLLPVVDKAGEPPRYNTEKLDGEIDPSAFNETGIDEVATGRGQVMNQKGCNWKPAQKGPGSRIAGINLIHSRLQTILPDGKPAILIFRNCKNLIRVLPTIPRDEGNPEDVDPDFPDDHPIDTLRYTLQRVSKLGRQVKLSGL